MPEYHIKITCLYEDIVNKTEARTTIVNTPDYTVKVGN